MKNPIQQSPTAGTDLGKEVDQFDAIIIGAGVTWLYSLYHLGELGFSVQSFEEGSGIGGTGFWDL